MDPNRLTQKTQEALHDAQTKALRFGHTEVDVEHLLLALLEEPDGLIPRLLTRMDVDSDALRGAVERQLEGRPRVSGAGRGAGPGLRLARAEPAARRRRAGGQAPQGRVRLGRAPRPRDARDRRRDRRRPHAARARRHARALARGADRGARQPARHERDARGAPTRRSRSTAATSSRRRAAASSTR